MQIRFGHLFKLSNAVYQAADRQFNQLGEVGYLQFMYRKTHDPVFESSSRYAQNPPRLEGLNDAWHLLVTNTGKPDKNALEQALMEKKHQLGQAELTPVQRQEVLQTFIKSRQRRLKILS